jgi:hypothetical protein
MQGNGCKQGNADRQSKGSWEAGRQAGKHVGQGRELKADIKAKERGRQNTEVMSVLSKSDSPWDRASCDAVFE